MRRLNTGIIGPMVLVRGDWWHWCDNWQNPLVRKVMHCELVHRVGALCTVPWCALTVCTDSLARCTDSVLYPDEQLWCCTLVQRSGPTNQVPGSLTNTCNSSPSFFNAAPTLPSYHQRSRTSNRRLIIMNWCCHIDNRSYSPESDFNPLTISQ